MWHWRFPIPRACASENPCCDGQVTINPNPVSTQTNTETIAINPENNPTPPSLPSPPSSVHQPDDEPSHAEGEGSSPHTAIAIDPNLTVEVPLPADAEDGLTTHQHDQDHWEVQSHRVIRHHVQPRLHMFFPLTLLNVLFQYYNLQINEPLRVDMYLDVIFKGPKIGETM